MITVFREIKGYMEKLSFFVLEISRSTCGPARLASNRRTTNINTSERERRQQISCCVYRLNHRFSLPETKACETGDSVAVSGAYMCSRYMGSIYSSSLDVSVGTWSN